MSNFKVQEYWESRYKNGGNSGEGSYNTEAYAKAYIINSIIKNLNLRTLVEIGSGDGNNLLLYDVPISYNGYDLSKTAIQMCNEKTKRIPNSLKYTFTTDINQIDDEADLCLCLDVYYHQVEDNKHQELLDVLFKKNWKIVMVYTTDHDNNEGMAEHMRNRKFSEDFNSIPENDYEIVRVIEGINFKDKNGVEKRYDFPLKKKMFILKNKNYENNNI